MIISLIFNAQVKMVALFIENAQIILTTGNGSLTKQVKHFFNSSHYRKSKQIFISSQAKLKMYQGYVFVKYKFNPTNKRTNLCLKHKSVIKQLFTLINCVTHEVYIIFDR